MPPHCEPVPEPEIAFMSDPLASSSTYIAPPVTVLLVEDDYSVRLSVAMFLEGLQYQVTQATNGLEAWESFKKNPPSLVISDIKMPQMDGLELLRRIAASEHPVPVILLSGVSEASDVVDALRSGASDFLIKPIVNFHILSHAVNKCLERVRLLEQNRAYQAQLEKANSELIAHLHALEQDQQSGRQLQLKLYPQQDLQIGNYHFSHRMIPSLYLSGDFLEYIRFGDEHLGFYIADVSGHGVSSAFVTALLRHFSLNIHRETREATLDGKPIPFPTPADAMAYYNRELLAAGIDKYATIFMGLIDTKHNTLTYSVAGHLPMPILASGDSVQYLKGSGMPVGILLEAEYQNVTVQLPETFTLVLCSDGVLEILPADNLIDKEALLLEKVADSDRTQQGVEQALLLDVVSGAPDDIAVMTLVKTV